MRLAATAVVTASALLAAVAACAPSAPAADLPDWGVNNARVAAFGDAFTAGFGFDSRGGELSRAALHRCHEQHAYQQCSSNGTRGAAPFGGDQGLWNRVSYAAELMYKLNRGGAATPSRYRNVAISASVPRDWAPGGRHHGRLRAIARFRPNVTSRRRDGRRDSASGPRCRCASPPPTRR
jgi:hypothetical protein